MKTKNYGKENVSKSFVSDKQIMQNIKGWFRTSLDVFLTNVLCFVGGRKEMLDTLSTAPVMETLPNEHIVEIGHQIASDFDRRCSSVAGEVSHYGDIQFIRLEKFNGTVNDICVLAHESLHVAEDVLRELGLRDNAEGELLAYVQEHIFRTLLASLYRVNGFDVTTDDTKLG